MTTETNISPNQQPPAGAGPLAKAGFDLSIPNSQGLPIDDNINARLSPTTSN